MADRFRTVELERFTTRLSLVVSLTDAFTGDRPAGSPTVAIEGVDAEPVVNPSGYHVFRDLAADEVTVTVDAGPAYLDARATDVAVVDPTDEGTTLDPTDASTLPVEEIELVPAPAYPFPPGTTLLRGHVVDGDGAPVADADVSIEHREEMTTTTDENGEFVLFFAGLTDGDVGVSDGTTVVEVNKGDPTVQVSHAEAGSTSRPVEVPEGAVTTATIEYE